MSVGQDQINAGPTANGVKVGIIRTGAGEEIKEAVIGETAGAFLARSGMGEVKGALQFDGREVDRSFVINGPGTLQIMGNAAGGDTASN